LAQCLDKHYIVFMFEISVKSHFSSAHRLKGYDGACSNLHGHNWEVEVFLRGTRTNPIGMLVDFGKIKSAVRGALNKLDHKDLNSLPAFIVNNPTSENLAKHIFHALSELFRGESFSVRRVWVSESPGTSACYWEDGAEDDKAVRRKKSKGRAGSFHGYSSSGL